MEKKTGTLPKFEVLDESTISPNGGCGTACTQNNNGAY